MVSSGDPPRPLEGRATSLSRLSTTAAVLVTAVGQHASVFIAICKAGPESGAPSLTYKAAGQGSVITWRA